MTHHDHHHHHDHHDHHDHEIKSELTFDEKLIKLLDHWLKHNDGHAKTYMEWAGKANDNHMEAVGGLLEEVCELTGQIGEKFKAAADLVQKGK